MVGHRPTYLTKTRYANGLAALKWLWLAFNAPDRLPKVDEPCTTVWTRGHQIGELARRSNPGGMLLPVESPQENDRQSRGLLDKRIPLFEAGFLHPEGTGDAGGRAPTRQR